MLMRRWRWLIGAALILNILIMMYLVQQPLSSSTYSHQTQGHNLQQDGHSPETFANSVTVILRDFENFDNAIVDTIKELQSVLPGVKVLVIGDTQPYPPLHVDKTWNTDIVSLQVNLLHNYSSSRPDHLIKTKFVLLLPDGVRLKHWRNLQTAANHLGGKGRTKAVAVGVGQQPLQCLSLDVDLKRWQVTFTTHNASSDYCDNLFTTG
ncbi:hypothetical protein BaRGS_00007061 [Batillaria attramentaria]|uniref:FKRP stem domain-containing protein n=1 Tax=Batillaria attramentaria TaxID=370345 RepID=A0ABD0LQW0_9CAEN